MGCSLRLQSFRLSRAFNRRNGGHPGGAVRRNRVFHPGAAPNLVLHDRSVVLRRDLQERHPGLPDGFPFQRGSRARRVEAGLRTTPCIRVSSHVPDPLDKHSMQIVQMFGEPFVLRTPIRLVVRVNIATII